MLALRVDENSMRYTGGARCASVCVCHTSVNGVRNSSAALQGLNNAFLSLKLVSFASVKTDQGLSWRSSG